MDRNIKLDFQFERSLRIKSLKTEGQGALELFEHDIVDTNISIKRVIHKALKLAKELTYDHGDLTSEAYLAHPLRVATMALKYSKSISANDIVLALLHNVYEVTNVSKQFISEQFGEEMERTDPSDSNAWQQIIMQTKAAKKDLDEELESGRDRLLEMSSFDQEAAKKIVDDIDTIDQDPTLETLMTDLFDQFGIAIEELGDHCYYIKPDTVFAGDAFPGMREIGMSITFDRSSAMSNEQMTFISWDHPLVSTCIDLMLDGEQGSSSFGQILGTAAQAGLVAECTFLLEPVCPVSLGSDRFLPPTPIAVVVDHGGNDIKPNFDATKVREGNRKWLRSKIEILKKMVPVMIEAAEKLAEKDAVKNRKVAGKKMEKVLEDTIDRLERLKRLGHPVRESELTEAQNERDALRVHLAKSRLRLDSIRLSAIGA